MLKRLLFCSSSITFAYMKMWAIILFLLPILGLAYVLWHSWQILPLPPIGKVVVVLAMLLCVVCMFFNFLVGLDNLPYKVAQVVYEVGTSSIFVLLYAVILFLLLDIGRFVELVPHSFLRSSVVGSVSVTLVLGLLFLYGNIHYYNKEHREMELTSAQPLPSPMRLVLLSDLHLGYHNTRSDLSRWVDMINSESPDAVLICGDVVDISVIPLIREGMADEFRRLNAPVYACPGNHEYYAGIEQASDFYRSAGITMLRDTSVTIGGVVTVIGRDDRTNTRRMSVGALVATAPKTRYTILLDHQPYHLERAEKAGVDFQFSGHTHYGQVWPISWIEDAIYEDAYGGLVKGRTKYYVTSGMGIWGGKFRIGTCSEYVVATLK